MAYTEPRRAAAKPPAAPEKPAMPEATSSDGGSGRLSLMGATALVVGSIVGVGIFNLPTSLAAYGPITLVSLGPTTIGALALARLFTRLSTGG
jgi:APA family basic amino acid/polyamine antiporter